MDRPLTEHLLTGCLYFTTAKLERVLARWAEECFSDVDLAPNYAFAVMVVNDKPGINQTDLAGILQLAPSTVTRFIDKLEAKGWLKRDQRGRLALLRPTEKSQKAHQVIADGWAKFWKKYTGILGVDQGNGLAGQLHDVCERLQKSESG